MNANQKRPAQSINEQKEFYPNLGKSPNEGLIPIFNHDLTNELMVDARELHRKLKVTTRFNDWISRRIEEYDFKDGLEFYSNLSKTSKGSKGGRPTIEYQLSTIMAQELCLLDNSEFGKAIRLYLLQNLKESQDKSKVFNSIPFLTINGRKLYCYRSLQRLLGFSTKSSVSNIRRKYADQLHVHFRTAYVTEEYADLMLSRSEVRQMATKTLTAKPIVLSNQLSLSI